MGVHGLWKLIDKSGKPIPIETLENKILAVDVSIWLYQLVRGFDNAARPGSNVFLLGLFHRICKLLFHRIRPIFVFDGGVPSLKKKTIAARQRGHKKARESIEKVRQQLLENLIKQQALGDVLGNRVKIPKQFTGKQDELFWLPPVENEASETHENENIDDEEDEHLVKKFAYDFNSIDVNSEEFLKLPADVRHDILTELKETRKLNSWAKIHLMPEESDDFSNFQMGRLLKRRAVQVGLEKTEQELGSRGLTIQDLKNILTEQGVDLGQRIAGDSSTRFIYATGPELLKQKTLNTAESINEEKSELFRSEINLSSASSESEDDDVSCLYQKMASTENAGLSQQEILQLIKQQNDKNIREEKERTFEFERPGTSKQSHRSDVFETDPQPEVCVNDQKNVHRGKSDSGENKDKSKLELENFPDFNGGVRTTARQKDAVSNFNEGNDGDPHPVVEYRNFASTRENNYDIPNDEPKSSVGSNDIKNSPVELNMVKTTSSQHVEECPKNFLEIEINIEEPIEEDIFADVFSPKEEKNDCVKPSINKILTSIPGDVTSSKSCEENMSPLSKIESEKTEVSTSADYFPSKSSSDEYSFKSSISIETPIKPNDSSDENNKIESEVTICESDDDPKEADWIDNHSYDNQSSSSFSQLVTDSVNSVDAKQLDKLKDDLEQESLKLIAENRRGERLASTITEQITQDAQYLLQLFGIPFLIAPMEAEAQCAYLDLTGQTDGTISDDSDIWLFGANNVYKNFFDQRKFVKQFKATDILQCYRLTRDDLIMIAMLVGSDYTTGVTGVGPVNAIEIVANFPSSKSVSTPHQRLLKFVDSYSSSTLDQSLLKKLKSIEFSEEFPSDEVVRAYLSPVVDESKEKFTWSKPDLTQIRIFMRDKFGWDFQKTDKTLNPVLDKLSQSSTQKTIHNYFDWAFNNDQVSSVSKRVGKAVELMSGESGPSPPKKQKQVTTRSDPLQSSYSRRKFGKYKKETQVIDEAPVLEGSRAARAAAKAIMTATRKPTKSPQKAPPFTESSSSSSSSIPHSLPQEEHVDQYTLHSRTKSSQNPSTSGQSYRNNKASASTAAPLPSLSDILCGIEAPTKEENSNAWTPSRDLVSPYTKRKFGKFNQSSTSVRGSTSERQRDDQFLMPSKTPAQVAKERAARKLKEAKQRAIQMQKSKKKS